MEQCACEKLYRQYCSKIDNSFTVSGFTSFKRSNDRFPQKTFTEKTKTVPCVGKGYNSQRFLSISFIKYALLPYFRVLCKYIDSWENQYFSNFLPLFHFTIHLYWTRIIFDIFMVLRWFFSYPIFVSQQTLQLFSYFQKLDDCRILVDDRNLFCFVLGYVGRRWC